MKLLIVRQILLVSTLVKVQRTVWRIWILMLGCKGLDSCDALFWCIQEVFPQPAIANWHYLNMCTCLAVQLWGKKNQTLNMLWLTTSENLFYLFLHNNFFSSQDKWGSWRLGKEIWKSADLKTEKTKASADQGETLTLQKSKCGH